MAEELNIIEFLAKVSKSLQRIEEQQQELIELTYHRIGLDISLGESLEKLLQRLNITLEIIADKIEEEGLKVR